MRKIAQKILGWKSENTYYDWKKQDRLILKLLEQIGEKRLNEFIETGKIKDLENNHDDMQSYIFNKTINQIIKDFGMRDNDKESIENLEIIASAIYNSNNVDEMNIKSKLYSKDAIDTKISNILFWSYSDIEKKLLIENKEEVIDKLTKFIQSNIPDVNPLYQMNLILESNCSVKVDDI